MHCLWCQRRVQVFSTQLFQSLWLVLIYMPQLCLSPDLSALRAAKRVSSESCSHLLSRTSNWRDMVCSKLVTTIVSTFTAYYIYLWPTYFPSTPLAPPFLPSFDGRAVVYPNTRILRDYMSWRQVDCEFSFICLRGLGFLIQSMQVISITSTILLSGLWFCKVVWPTPMRNKSWRYAHSIDSQLSWRGCWWCNRALCLRTRMNFFSSALGSITTTKERYSRKEACSTARWDISAFSIGTDPNRWLSVWARGAPSYSLDRRWDFGSRGQAVKVSTG